MGYEAYQARLCPGCGFPKEQAWHSEWDGFYEATKVVCHACSAALPEGDQTTYVVTVDTRDPDAPAPPPFEIGVTTTTPTERKR